MSSRPGRPGRPGLSSQAKGDQLWLLDRYKYKQDIQGYLLSGRHTYIYLLDLESKKIDRLTRYDTHLKGGLGE
jgi:hypothetical protein